MKDIPAIIILFILIAAGLFIAHIEQQPDSPAANWVHDTAIPAIKNSAKNAIKEIPFSGLINWQ